MMKIKSLFRYAPGFGNGYLNEITPGTEWAMEGQGKATRKWDGTACAVIAGQLFARYDAKQGKSPPEGAQPCQDRDEETGHWPHWVLVADQPQYRYHREALANAGGSLADGTYELVGPKINRNPDAFPEHTLVPHGNVVYWDVTRTFEGLRDFLQANSIEGLVFHSDDGRMTKVTTRGFGLPWPKMKE